MKTLDLVQGSPEWLAHRAKHFNGSDAPAMLGCGLKTRSDLLAELHAVYSPEASQYVQERVFDPGHRFEAMARPLAEEIIGDDLCPVTGTEGKYSASFDGLTMDGRLAFEHKRLNQTLAKVFDDIDTINPEHRDSGSGGDLLPLMYRVQMEHQALVSGCEKILFMASEWSNDGQLIAERHVWYWPSSALRAKIIAGWAQFAADLAAYTPPAATAPKPTGHAPDTLPALRIEVTGMVTASNLDEFKATALTAIRSVNRELTTDQDFADAEKAVKWCADVESRLDAAKAHALSQTATIDMLFKTIDDIAAEAKRVRLDLGKLVTSRKDAIRLQAVTSAKGLLAEHEAALNQRIGKPLMPHLQADFAGAIKGKRSIDSINDAISVELARAKIEANEVADRITLNLRAIDATGMPLLFADMHALVLKDADSLAAIIESRVNKYRAEEAARLPAERVKAEQAIRAEAQRQADEAARAAAQAAIEAAQAAPAPAPAAAITPAPALLELDAADTGALINLGDINARIDPLAISVNGLAQLGFVHVRQEKASKLYREADFPRMCAAMTRHINTAAVEA